ncbi:MAG: sigma-54 dependent transcriptional regulator [Acidobacteriota bacterium]
MPEPVQTEQALLDARVLVVDDEPGLRTMLKILFESSGARVQTAEDGRAALKQLGSGGFDAVVTDISMPGMNGHELLAHLVQEQPELPVVMMTAVNNDIADAVEAIKRGAFDYIQKGFFNNDELVRRVANAVERKRLREENLRLRVQLEGAKQGGEIIGSSSRMMEILSVVSRVAPTEATVLITGESGTGKELVARSLHEGSGRSGRFLTINCGAFPDELLESELFGHEKGAFTGAVAAKRGLFEEADGGTLFLDEAGETSPAMQVKLLRVLQEGTFRPVGSTQERGSEVRIVAATNRDLEEMVREGTFREDLYYRINVIPIHLPPLRERRGDIQGMVRHFVEMFAARMNRPGMRVSPKALEALEHYDWPGNVRELKNVIERAIALATSESIEVEALPENVREGKKRRRPSGPAAEGDELPDGVRLDDYLDDLRKRLISSALEETGGNQTRAAQRLGVTFRSLRYYAGKYGLKGGVPAGEGSGGTG